MSSHSAVAAPACGPVDETLVADFLRRNPAFFARFPELVTELQIPHESGRAVSLFERQVELLRKEVTRLQRQIKALVGVAGENERLTTRLHRLTLALIDAADFNEVLNTLEDHLHEQFQADAVELRLLSEGDLEGDEEAREVFLHLFDGGHPLCGPLQPAQMSLLFGTQAPDLHSAALLPLSSDELRGILAIGSGDPERFHPDMGTDFLTRLGEVVSLKLQVVSLPGV